MKRALLSTNRSPWFQASRLSAVLMAAAALAACSSDDDPKDLKETHDEPPSVNCEFGGKVHISGRDANGDGKLSADEIKDRRYDCKPDPNNGVTDGTERLNETHPEAPGANCPFGGQRNITGIDKNKDGSLSFSEIDDESFVCDADPNLPPPSGVRLSEVRVIASSPTCVNGGQEFVSGVDADESGDLQHDEIDQRTVNCIAGPPGGVMTDIEIVPIGDVDCAHGGKRYHHGEDTDADGVLQVGERESTVTVCDAAPGVCDGVEPLVLEWAFIPRDAMWSYVPGEEYPVQIALNRSLANDSRVFEQFNEALAPDADFSVVELPNNQWETYWHTEVAPQHRTQLLVGDACGTVLVPLTLPNVDNFIHGITATVTPGVYDVGDTLPFCWEARDVDTCSLRYFQTELRPLPLSGCDSVVLEPAHVTPTMVEGLQVFCQKPGGMNMVAAGLAVPRVPMIRGLDTLGSRFLPEEGGYVLASWNTGFMESCEMVVGDERISVPTSSTAHPIPVHVSGGLRLECVDEDATVYTYSSANRILVGAGITYFNSNVASSSGDLHWNVSAGTHFLDGDCEFTLTRGDFTVSQSNLSQTNPDVNRPYSRILNAADVLAGDAGLVEPTDPMHLELSCENADGSERFTETVVVEYGP